MEFPSSRKEKGPIKAEEFNPTNIQSWTSAVAAMRRQLAAMEQRAQSQQASPNLLQETIEALHITLEQLDQTGQELSRQQEELEAARAEAEAERTRYQELFTFAPDGYLVTDTRGKIQEANQAAATLFNFTTEFLQGRLLLNFITPEEHSRFSMLIAQICRGEPIAPWIGQMQRRRHQVFDAAITAAPVVDRTGQVVAIRWMLRDVRDQLEVERRAQHFATRLRHLRTIDQALLAAHSPTEIVDVTLDHVRALIPCRHAAVIIFAPETGTATVRARSFDDGAAAQEQNGQMPLPPLDPLLKLQYGEYCLARDLRTLDEPYAAVRGYLEHQSMQATLSMPLVVQQQAIGILLFGATAADTFTHEHISIAQEITDQLAVAIQQSRLFEVVQTNQERTSALSRQLLDIQEQERRAIARELHDEVGQALTGLQLSLGMLRRSATPEQQPQLTNADSILVELMERINTMSLNLRPSVLDNLGVLPALARQIDRYTQQTGIQVDFHHAGLNRRFPLEIETVAYRVVQEALTNVARYAGVVQVQVQVTVQDEPQCIMIEILDEGQGFDLPATLNAGTSSGVSGMYERVGLVSGNLFIETAPGQGTTIIAEIPLP
jgi:PAS domain S-box-containing protein